MKSTSVCSNIKHLKRLKKMIPATVFFYLCFFPLVDTYEIKVPVTEGDSFTLRSRLTEIRREDEVEWRFGSSRTLITTIAKGNIKYGVDKRFRERLQLERQTGDLTITNVTNEHDGVYELSINDSLANKFSVAVYAPLPVPVITRYSPQCSSSSSSSVSRSVLLCSAVNVSHVTLSWYKESGLLSSVSVSDLSLSLSLPLELESQDKNTYSCVIKNPFSNRTEHLDMSGLCQDSCDNDWSGGTEAVIRLVTTAVVGVAAVAAVVVLVYDIRCRRVELEWKIQFIKE